MIDSVSVSFFGDWRGAVFLSFEPSMDSLSRPIMMIRFLP